jgi:hypothetical protein
MRHLVLRASWHIRLRLEHFCTRSANVNARPEAHHQKKYRGEFRDNGRCWHWCVNFSRLVPTHESQGTIVTVTDSRRGHQVRAVQCAPAVQISIGAVCNVNFVDAGTNFVTVR